MGHLQVLIINGSAGCGRARLLAKQTAGLVGDHFENLDVQMVKTGAEVAIRAREAIDAGAKLVIAGGGDGTVNAVATAAMGSEAVLGVLPLGTCNHLARDLGMPLDLTSAVDVLARGHIKRIDVGEVNGRIFLNNASLGLYPALVTRRAQLQRQGLGRLPALFLAWSEVLRDFPVLDVTSPTLQTTIFRTPFVLIANNPYGFSKCRWGYRARLDSGQLVVYTTRCRGRLGLLKSLLGCPWPERWGGLMAESTSECVLQMEMPEVLIALDGEVIKLENPLNFKQYRRALPLIASATRPVDGITPYGAAD